jgi:superfamily II DNA helicase RecQ
VVASLDQAVGEGSARLRGYLRALDAAGALTAIVLDECHLVLTAASYREKIARVHELRGLRYQHVYLTATLPPALEPRLAERLMLRSPAVVRSRTARTGIRYHVQRLRPNSGALVAEAVACIEVLLRDESFTGEPAARAIVYYLTRAEAESVAQALGCLCYHAGSGTVGGKAALLHSWISAGAAPPPHRVLAATSAFLEGIDYAQVRLVFHVGAPDSCLAFAQAIGRGGRDSGAYSSYIFLASDWRGHGREATGELLDSDAAAMDRYLDQPRCRLAVLS